MAGAEHTQFKKESQAHEALTLLHQREGVPNVMVMDNAQTQIRGKFRQICRSVGTHCKQTEPHTPQSNAAEGVINQLKTKVGMKMVKSKAPKRLWDDCLELEAYCRSCTALDIYGLGGQVPETVVSGETADISPFAIHQWYEWVKFRETTVAFPEDKLVLGRDLGPAIDIGPAMTRKVLKANGQVEYRSTVRPLTPEEIASSDGTES